MERPCVVRFDGELDLWKAGEIARGLAVIDGSAPVVIDLCGVRYVDSTFLNALVHLRRRVPTCAIAVAVANPTVRRIFALTELDRLVDIVPCAGSDGGGSPPPSWTAEARATQR